MRTRTLIAAAAVLLALAGCSTQAPDPAAEKWAAHQNAEYHQCQQLLAGQGYPKDTCLFAVPFSTRQVSVASEYSQCTSNKDDQPGLNWTVVCDAAIFGHKP